MDNELSEPIYENYDEDLQAFNGTGVILTSEEIKELFNCKGEWEVTDGVTDMSYRYEFLVINIFIHRRDNLWI